MQRVLFATVFSLLIATALSAETRKWTSKDGRFSTEAELVDQDDTSVTLKKQSGDIVTVSLEHLSAADRRYLLTLKKKATPSKEKKEGNTEKKESKENKGSKEIAVSYATVVQPFLSQYCAECHNHGKATAGYDVTNYAALTKRGKYGALVVPGKPDISRLCEVMEGMSKSMPPSGSTQPMPDEIAKIVAWVKGGATDDSSQSAGGGKSRGSGSKKSSR
jgi:mono/diheme cytochrome c family protein